MKKIEKRKVRTKILLILIMLFVAWNVIWGINFSLYDQYIEGYEKIEKSYGKNVNGINYTVKRPFYLSLTGNYCITNEVNTISIFIWPSLFMKGEYEYGIMIYDEEREQGYMFYVNSNMEYLHIKKNKFSVEEIEEIEELIRKNREEIQLLNQIAKKEWNLK